MHMEDAAMAMLKPAVFIHQRLPLFGYARVPIAGNLAASMESGRSRIEDWTIPGWANTSTGRRTSICDPVADAFKLPGQASRFVTLSPWSSHPLLPVSLPSTHSKLLPVHHRHTGLTGP